MKLKGIFVTALMALGALSFTACGGKKNTYVDYAHNHSVELKLDYTGKSFWTDGIEQVKFKTHIDGDTVHFETSTGQILKSRFYGIDTPESTGKIQEYGKAASNFTKEKIKKAAENGTIVVSSPQNVYAAPQPDTTGERYLSLVWISENTKNCPYKDLALLNLLIVQEGYSWVKNVAAFPEYSETFYAAENQAKELKKNLFSGEKDPEFNYGGYEDVSLLDIKNEVIASYKDSSHTNKYDNAKVRVQGTVAGIADHVLYIVNHFEGDDFAGDANKPEGYEEYAGLNIFTGMGSIPSRFYEIGAYVEVCGTCTDSENFGFQMSGCSFQNVSYSADDAKVIYKASETPTERQLKTFEYDIAGFDTMIQNNDFDKMYCSVACTSTLECTKAFKSNDGDFTLSFAGTDLQAYVTFPYEDKDGAIYNEESNYLGKKFKLSGIYVPHKTTSGKQKFQINPLSKEYLQIVEDAAE